MALLRRNSTALRGTDMLAEDVVASGLTVRGCMALSLFTHAREPFELVKVSERKSLESYYVESRLQRTAEASNQIE
jgi:hypothetical protein